MIILTLISYQYQVNQSKGKFIGIQILYHNVNIYLITVINGSHSEHFENYSF